MKRSFLWRSLQVIARIGTTLWFDLKAHGESNVPADGGVLLVANHQSYLDPVLVAVRLDRPVSFLAKSELFENKFFGWLIRSLHAFPVRQGRGDVRAIKETVERLQEGHVLNVYPEGSRTEDGELGDVQAGIALIVRKAGVPIIPVAIIGAFNAWPKSRKLPRAGRARVIYGKPLDVSGLKSAEVVKLIERTLRSLLDQLYAMHPEVPRGGKSSAEPQNQNMLETAGARGSTRIDST